MVRRGLLAAVTAALSCSLTGCWAIYSTRPVEIIATTSDTGQPVTNLPVSVEYSGMLIRNVPKPVSGVTDENGRVLLPIADYGNNHIYAGEFRSFFRPETVRDGGTITRWSQVAGETSNVVLQMVPQHRSLAQRLFGWLE